MEDKGLARFKRSIAKNIRRIREEKNVTQSELSDTTNLHIARLEQGTSNPSAKTLYSLATVLGVKVTDLLRDISNEQ